MHPQAPRMTLQEQLQLSSGQQESQAPLAEGKPTPLSPVSLNSSWSCAWQFQMIPNVKPPCMNCLCANPVHYKLLQSGIVNV